MQSSWFPSTLILILQLCLFTAGQTTKEFEILEDEWFKILNNRYRVFSPPPTRGSPGEPLFLSPYLEGDGVERAKKHSRVNTEHMIEGIESHAGYITVNKEYNSNLWFWYFPAEETDVTEAPLVIWLQGGPGASSLFGLFEELGPFSVDAEGNHLIENPYSWHKNHSLLFIDNPVGTGFSFTNHEDGYCRNQTQIGEQLYSFMYQFLKLFPELQKVPLYISGESYAGKHIPSLAYQIHRNNPRADMKINLQGLAIGNGFMDPATMMAYSAFVYQLGMADDSLATRMASYERGAEATIAARDYRTAFRFFGATLGSFIQESEVNSLYNYVYEESGALYGPFTKFIQNSDIRRALHVGNTPFSGIGKVYSKLIDDFMASAKPWMEELMEHYKIMSYSGQMDIICAYPLSVRTYRSMNWSGAPEYLDAPRKPWYFGKVLAGYVKKSKKFQEVMIRNAGHMVPTDQPERSLVLLSSFIRDIPLPDTEDEGRQSLGNKEEVQQSTEKSKEKEEGNDSTTTTSP